MIYVVVDVQSGQVLFASADQSACVRFIEQESDLPLVDIGWFEGYYKARSFQHEGAEVYNIQKVEVK